MHKHLQVLTLADITTGYGTQIKVSVKKGKSGKYPTSQYKWPKEAPTQRPTNMGQIDLQIDKQHMESLS